MSMTIDTGTTNPVSQKPYPIAMKHYQWVKDEIEKLLATKVIPTSCSSWSAPIIVVPKGGGGKCLVKNYRALNKVTRKFTWPMPKVEPHISQPWIFEQDTITFPWINHLYPKQHLIHPSENLNMRKSHLDLLKHQHTFKN